MTVEVRHTNLTENWKQEIWYLWRIKLLADMQWEPQNSLWTTRCCKTKRARNRGKPKDFYFSPIVQLFCKFVEQNGLKYGILSDKYGLHLDSEELEYYDIHPASLTSQDKEKLGQLIREKVLRISSDSIVFYNPSPLMSIPYFEMLHYSGLNIWYTTRLTFPLTLSLGKELMRDRR